MKRIIFLVLLNTAFIFTAFAQNIGTQQSLLVDDISGSSEVQTASSIIPNTPNRSNNSVTFEDFEGGIYPPYGWKATSGGGDHTFYLSRKGVRSGTHCVASTSTDVTDPDRLLITPKLAIYEGNSIVSLWITNHNPTFPQPYDVLVSTTGNEAEDFSLFEAAPDPGGTYAMKSFDFSTYNGQEIYVAFRPTTTHKYALYIDDVSLPTIVFPFDKDLAVTNIFPPAVPFGQFVPQVVVTNYGNTPASNFTVELSDGGTYNEVVNVSLTIERGDRITLDFPMYEPEAEGSREFVATVNLAADENTENDSYIKNIYMYAPIFEQHEIVNEEGAHITGADVSMLLETQTGLGKGFNYPQQFLLADDFIIPGGQTWTINGFRFFGYQTESSLESTLYGGYIKIFRGKPNLPDSELIVDYGDENLLISSNFINAYRIESYDYSNTSRPIMDMICRIPEMTLEEGEYWVAVGADASLDRPNGPQIGPYQVHLQFKDGNPETGNAIRLFMGGVMEWTDGGYPQGMPFDVFGSKTGHELPLPRDLNASVNEQNVSLSWQEPIYQRTEKGTSDYNLLGYNIYRNNTKIGETDADQSTYLDTNVAPGTYTYGVSAVYGQPYPGESEKITHSVEVLPGIPPVINVNPESLYQYFFTSGDTETQVLTIGNTGEGTLEWSATVQYTSKSVFHPPIPEGPVTNNHIDLSVAKFEAGGSPILPESREDIILHYDGENAGNGIGLTGGGSFYVAARFPASMVAGYAGFELKEVDVYINELPSTMSLYVWSAGTTTSPGSILHQQNLNPQEAWNSFSLPTPVLLDGNDIWVGYHISHIDGLYPAGCDEGPAHPDGGWLSTDGSNWQQMANLGLNFNWNLRAKISGISQWLSLDTSSGTIAPGANQQVNVQFNSSGLEIGEYTAHILINSNDVATPVLTVPVNMDIGVGVEENDMKNVQVYPVPANSILFIDLVEGVSQIRMINIMGQIVKDETVNGELRKTLDLTGLQSGTYSLQFINNKGETHYKHIIISK